MPIQSLIRHCKPFVRWTILALTLAFLLHSLHQNWQQIVTLRLTAPDIALLVTATGVTLLAHIWSGWVWYRVMQWLHISVDGTWAIIVYLKTNLAKYLPGNVWHFLGRVQALRSQNIPLSLAVTGVVLEPLLMAAAALALVVISQPSALLQLVILIGVLMSVHPWILNPILQRLSATKLQHIQQSSQRSLQSNPPVIRRYPVTLLLGEIGFVAMRGVGFLLVLAALQTVSQQDWWFVIGNFSLAWLLGLVIPGAPGGLGVFEATALALLTPQVPAATVLGAVAVYRLISTLAEAIGAGLAKMDEQWNRPLYHLPLLAGDPAKFDSDHPHQPTIHR